ncbi:hypothetical protein BH10PSE1_BH10PSE1_19120 [soil metagenome]
MTQAGIGSSATGDDGLDDLRADLARLILNEAGQALGRNPDLPLSAALVQAVERQTAQAARNSYDRIPSAEALADAVLDSVGPELIRIARAAGSGDVEGLDRRPSGLSMQTMIGVAVAVVAGVLLFVGGFVTAKMLPDKPVAPAVATAPVSEPVVIDPTVAAPAVTSAAPTSGQPAR